VLSDDLTILVVHAASCLYRHCQCLPHLHCSSFQEANYRIKLARYKSIDLWKVWHHWPPHTLPEDFVHAINNSPLRSANRAPWWSSHSTDRTMTVQASPRTASLELPRAFKCGFNFLLFQNTRQLYSRNVYSHVHACQSLHAIHSHLLATIFCSIRERISFADN
jgi:hypothetical protein